MPTLDDEVTYITGVDSSGTVADTSFKTWTGTPAALYTKRPSGAAKWGGTAAGTSGTVNYTFDAAWTETERAEFRAVFAFYSAVANITFNEVPSLSGAGITITKAADKSASAGGSLRRRRFRKGGWQEALERKPDHDFH